MKTSDYIRLRAAWEAKRQYHRCLMNIVSAGHRCPEPNEVSICILRSRASFRAYKSFYEPFLLVRVRVKNLLPWTWKWKEHVYTIHNCLEINPPDLDPCCEPTRCWWHCKPHPRSWPGESQGFLGKHSWDPWNVMESPWYMPCWHWIFYHLKSQPVQKPPKKTWES